MTNNFSQKKPLIKRIWYALLPPPFWRFPVIILLGIMVGLGLMIVKISKAYSYMSNSPMACVNCHVMVPQYTTLRNSSHKNAATCNDCHVPHDNIFETYFFKASDGLRHSYMFTLRLEPQVIVIKEAGKRAVQNNCIRCHENQIHPVSLRAIKDAHTLASGERFCWDCHREVPHGRVNSLASTPYARAPLPEEPLPNWLQKLFNNNKN
ncbi:MAG: cytochrome c nitrite reductase small subunit [Ignavibacteriaceae bacterium]|nr:cytochrome c nitrite reductase small subunit [Ignavibacteriaceae bacterium]